MDNKTTFSRFIALAATVFVLSTQTQGQVVLYGLTARGGTNNVGTVFSVTPSGNLVTIANLNSTYAAAPYGSLLYASDGNFYASSIAGGYGDSCTIFSCSPTGTLRIMINLDSVWGSSDPTGNSLIQALDGNLYGMTTISDSTFGVIFKLKLSGQYDSIHTFSGFDGAYPYGSLIQTKDSMLWGMTSAGGGGLGNIFKCTTTGKCTSVFSFDSLDGINPYGDLLLANDGNFYGITSAGGRYGYGTLFRYDSLGLFTKLFDFDSINGRNPCGSLIQASDNNLYGLCLRGGDSGYGTLFSCTLFGSLTTLVSFNNNNGANPYGTLIQASDGYLYGMTTNGGTYNYGTIFQCTLSGTLIKLDDFNGNNGQCPEYGKMIEVDSLTTSLNKISNIKTPSLFPNPNNGQFTIQLSGISSQSSVEIYNVLGEKVFSRSNINYSTLKIDLSGQPNGVYLYRVMNENGNVVSNGKFVIEK